MGPATAKHTLVPEPPSENVEARKLEFSPPLSILSSFPQGRKRYSRDAITSQWPRSLQSSFVQPARKAPKTTSSSMPRFAHAPRAAPIQAIPLFLIGSQAQRAVP